MPIQRLLMFQNIYAQFFERFRGLICLLVDVFDFCLDVLELLIIEARAQSLQVARPPSLQLIRDCVQGSRTVREKAMLKLLK